MRTSQIISAIFLLATTGVVANSCTCGGRYYDDDTIRAAINKALRHNTKHTRIWGYPHTFRDYNDFFGEGNSNLEYPIKHGGVFDNGQNGQTGDDRVIFSKLGNFYGCVTHEGTGGASAFKKCSSDD